MKTKNIFIIVGIVLLIQIVIVLALTIQNKDFNNILNIDVTTLAGKGVTNLSYSDFLSFDKAVRIVHSNNLSDNSYNMNLKLEIDPFTLECFSFNVTDIETGINTLEADVIGLTQETHFFFCDNENKTRVNKTESEINLELDDLLVARLTDIAETIRIRDAATPEVPIRTGDIF